MVGYLFLFLGLVLFSLLCKGKGKEQSALIVLGLTLIFVYMALDMYKIHDVSLYQQNFNYYKNFSLGRLNQIETYEEQGYVALNILFSKIGGFRFFYFFYAVCVIASFLFFIKKYSNSIWFSSILLICTSFLALFVMRQYFAIVICLFSINYIFKRKPLHFFLCIILAYYFHRSSIVFSVCYFLPLIKLNYRTLLLTLLGSIIVFMSIGYISEILISSILDNDMASHYMAYIEEDSSNSWKSAAIAVADLGFALLCYREHFKELSTKQCFFFFMCVIYTVLSIVDVLGSAFSALYRILPYFGISIIILLPDAISFIKSKGLRFMSIMVIVLLYAVLLISTAGPWFYFTF